MTLFSRTDHRPPLFVRIIMPNRSWLHPSLAARSFFFFCLFPLFGGVGGAFFVLHVLQSLIYVTVIWLSLQRSKWGYAIGISIALIWNSYNLFTGFVFRAGFRQ